MAFIEALEDALGWKPARTSCPATRDVPDTAPTCRASTTYQPQTTLEDGIARFVAWYREYYD
jgi:UDP-glucuronate 4-epimerase